MKLRSFSRPVLADDPILGVRIAIKAGGRAISKDASSVQFDPLLGATLVRVEFVATQNLTDLAIVFESSQPFLE